MREEEGAAARSKLFRDRLAFRRGCRAVDHKRFHACPAQKLRERGLSIQKLREDNGAMLSSCERNQEFAFAAPTRFLQNSVAPSAGDGGIRIFFKRGPPRGRATAGGLEQKPSPQAGPARAQKA